MKKNLSRMLVVLLMGTFLFPTVGNAADAPALTAQEKYDALAAKGIFSGINGAAALDQNMTRAQFARVAALILGLEGIGATDTTVVTEKPFSDVELGTWYIEEIATAKKAGIIDGYPDGTFNPKGDISVQELAVATARVLGEEPVEDAEVEGAAKWAAGSIQALINSGVDFPTNYTQPATRAQLTDLAFHADVVIMEKKEEAQKEHEEAQKKLEDEKKQEEQYWYLASSPTLSPLDLINAASASGSWANVDVTTFVNAGITGVTTSNVLAVKVALESGGSSPRNVSEIQAIVNVVIDDITKQAALDLINDESERGILTILTETQVTVTTFADAGVQYVTSDNLFAINYYLEISSKSYPRSTTDIQKIVDETIEELTVLSIYEYLTPFFGFGPSKPDKALFARAGITGLTDLDEDEFDYFLDEFESTYINFPSNNGGVPMQTKQQIQEVVDFYLDYLALQ
ncbi:MAG: S-layer homology domain-containing protein [Candidatus Cohnella colombiensis]|uniref:S-layer homology domain-containing protein n=1 Tax=Candidatus Cohnella colombiensis TaxID=3121368 RepID=A0AA95JG59_9BACL|nr:MAG: S-layer homology domain-containing protein [Cohnella sp.]